MKPSPEQRVIAAARNIAAAQVRARELRQSVDWSKCERVDEGGATDDYGNTYPAQGFPPCPFLEVEIRGEWGSDIGSMREEDWCEPCRENWHRHGQWKQERAKRTGYLRTLEFAVAALEKTGVTP